MVTLIYGDNEFALLAEKQRRVREFLEVHDAFGLEQLDCSECDAPRLRDALLQLPFLVSKKLVVLRDVFAQKWAADLLLALWPQIPAEIDVLIVESKPDKRTKLFKELAAQKNVHDYRPLQPRELLAWASAYAASLGSTLSARAASALVDRAGENQMRLAREIEKLAVEPEISEELVSARVDQHLEASIFDLLDAVVAKQNDRACALYSDLLSLQTDPNEIMSMIAWQLHVLASIVYAPKKDTHSIAAVSGIHPFVIGKTLPLAARLSRDDVKRMVHSALQTDIAIKSGKAAADDAVRLLILELSQR
jgi:DNA polymerase-3 subunit delta